MATLSQLRDQIDTLDQQLLQLINQRAEVVRQVGELKKQQQSANKSANNQDNTDSDANSVRIVREEREAQIFRRFQEDNSGPLPNQEMECIFREIISSCRSLEGNIRIAYLGPDGTYSEQAAVFHFGRSEGIIKQPQIEIADVFQAVEKGNADFGVIPIENSTEGPVNQSLDALMLAQNGVICGEINLPINHCFLSLQENIDNLSNIKTLYIHQQTYSQCSHWIKQHSKNWQVEQVSSNALAAKKASQNKESATIASDIAAKRFKLNILDSNIQDYSNNTTRFIVFGKHPVDPSGNDKTSIIFATQNKVGALHNCLSILKKHNINITFLLSRPDRSQKWDYLFFVDLIGHRHQTPLKECLAELEQDVRMLKILGSYPCAYRTTN